MFAENFPFTGIFLLFSVLRLYYFFVLIVLAVPFFLTVPLTTQTSMPPARLFFRTRNPSKQSAAEPRLRPLGHWDRQGIDHRNFQPVASRYTDYAIPNPMQLKGANKSYFACKVQKSIKLAALLGLVTAVGSTDVNCVASR